MPFTADALIGSAQAMLYAGGPLPPLDTVQLDGSFGGAFLNATAQLDQYRAIYRTLEGVALDAIQSREVIHRIEHEL